MDRRIQRAFEACPREAFLREESAYAAGVDAPIVIGHGQTNSQPSTVRQMLAWLEVEEGDCVLDIGSGSGWTTALLAHLTGSRGHVTATEIVPELLEFGRENCARLGVSNAEFHPGGDELGWPAGAPYDRILVSASASSFPRELLDQLAPAGKLVIPVGHTIHEVTKDDRGDTSIIEHPGYVFVPLI